MRGLGGGGGARPPGQSGAQGLATLGEGRVDDGEDRVPVAGPRRVTARDAHEPGAHVRGRPEHVLPDVRRALDRAVPLRLDAGDAVRAGSGRGGQPIGDLGLDHDEHLPDGREGREEVEEDGDRDVVREVRDERGGLPQVVWQFGDAHRVGLHEREGPSGSGPRVLCSL